MNNNNNNKKTTDTGVFVELSNERTCHVFFIGDFQQNNNKITNKKWREKRDC